jgi:hypothetical protein
MAAGKERKSPIKGSVSQKQRHSNALSLGIFPKAAVFFVFYVKEMVPKRKIK